MAFSKRITSIGLLVGMSTIVASASFAKNVLGGAEFGQFSSDLNPNGLATLSWDESDYTKIATQRDRLSQISTLSQPERASSYFKIGVLLFHSGEAGGETRNYEEALEAFQEGEKGLPQALFPRHWLFIENALGNTLAALGERQGNAPQLEKSLSLFRKLLEPASQQSPQTSAMIRSNLGWALLATGQLQSNSAQIKEAVEVFREALKSRTREQAPLLWAGTENNLATALQILGAQEDGTAHLEEAASAYQAVMQVVTRDADASSWADIQYNLGTALAMLGERRSLETRDLEGAVIALREALKVYTPGSDRLKWIRAETNLCNALTSVGERKRGTKRLEDAVRACQDAQNALPIDATIYERVLVKEGLERAENSLARKRRKE